jgi:hypothetical protein
MPTNQYGGGKIAEINLVTGDACISPDAQKMINLGEISGHYGGMACDSVVCKPAK